MLEDIFNRTKYYLSILRPEATPTQEPPQLVPVVKSEHNKQEPEEIIELETMRCSRQFDEDNICGLSCSVLGESHRTSNKECQDYSFCFSNDIMKICIVSDGHGGDRYFRSAIGSKFATEVTLSTIKEFIESEKPRELLSGEGFKSYGVQDERNFDSPKEREIASMFDQLFRSIITQWGCRVDNDVMYNPVNKWEAKHVKKEYLDSLTNQHKIEKIYGCTLTAYVQTKQYWFAFQIGDGKCISFGTNGKAWEEPIPWDEQCFLNQTTSICGSNAINEFRFCYDGSGNFPTAIFMGSDGIDDTFHEIENVASFNIAIADQILKRGVKETLDDLLAAFPDLSKRGSRDDISIACIVDKKKLHQLMPDLYDSQIAYLQSQEDVDDLDKRINILTTKKNQYLE